MRVFPCALRLKNFLRDAKTAAARCPKDWRVEKSTSRKRTYASASSVTLNRAPLVRSNRQWQLELHARRIIHPLRSDKIKVGNLNFPSPIAGEIK